MYAQYDRLRQGYGVLGRQDDDRRDKDGEPQVFRLGNENAERLSLCGRRREKEVAKVVARGHADVFLTYREEAGKAAEYRVDAELASKYVATASGLASLTGVPCDVTATALMKNPDIVTLEAAEADDEELKALLLAALGEALDGLVAMREREGAALAADISAKLDSMSASLAK